MTSSTRKGAPWKRTLPLALCFVGLPLLAAAAGPNPIQAGLKAAETGNFRLAILEFSEAIEGNLQTYNAYCYRAQCYNYMSAHDNALADYTAATRLKPGAAAAWHGRGWTLILKRDYRGAVPAYEQAIQKAPDSAREHNFLAWLLATCSDDSVRDGSRAVAEAEKACQLTKWKNSYYLDTLAAAYAETGRFDEAIKWQKAAIALIDQPGQDLRGKARSTRSHLRLYEKRRPVRGEL